MCEEQRLDIGTEFSDDRTEEQRRDYAALVSEHNRKATLFAMGRLGGYRSYIELIRATPRPHNAFLEALDAANAQEQAEPAVKPSPQVSSVVLDTTDIKLDFSDPEDVPVLVADIVPPVLQSSLEQERKVVSEYTNQVREVVKQLKCDEPKALEIEQELWGKTSDDSEEASGFSYIQETYARGSNGLARRVSYWSETPEIFAVPWRGFVQNLPVISGEVCRYRVVDSYGVVTTVTPSTITLVTGSASKSEEFRRLNSRYIVPKFRFEVQNVPMIEIQAPSAEIAAYKAFQAYQRLQTPVLIDDSALNVCEWGGMPGPYIKDYLAVNAVASLSDAVRRTTQYALADVVSCLAYYDGINYPVVYIGRVRVVVVPPKGVGGFGYDMITRPMVSRHTYSEMSDESKDRLSPRGVAFSYFYNAMRHDLRDS